MKKRAKAQVMPSHELPSRKRRGDQGRGGARRRIVLAPSLSKPTMTCLATKEEMSAADGEHGNSGTHATRVPVRSSQSAPTMWSLSPKPFVSAPTNVELTPSAVVSASNGSAGGLIPIDTQARNASGWSADSQGTLAHVVRQAWAAQKIRIGVNNQLKRLEREGFEPDLMTSVEALLEGLERTETIYKRRAEKLMRQHPLAAWIEEQPGIGLLSAGYILASTGPLTNFANPAKVWKFLGMHVSNGMAPKRAAGQKAGWSQRGRMTCFQIGDAIVKVGEGPWHKVYTERREAVLARPRTGASGCPFGREHIGDERKRDETLGWERKTGAKRIVQCVKLTDGKETSAHVFADAKRVAVKAFLKEFWRRSTIIIVSPVTAMSSAPDSSGRAS